MACTKLLSHTKRLAVPGEALACIIEASEERRFLYDAKNAMEDQTSIWPLSLSVLRGNGICDFKWGVTTLRSVA